MSEDTLDHAPPDGTGHTQFLDLTEEAGYYDDDDDEDDGEGSAPGYSGSTTTTTVGGVQVVETGLEHTGRWTREEHEAFLSALHQYGKEWKKVAAKVKTRTVVQTRTHAQKYFQKLSKAMSDKGEDTSSLDNMGMGIGMGIGMTPEAKKAKRKKNLTKSRSHSTTAAAQLMTNLSSGIPGISAQTSAAYPTPHGFSQSSLVAAADSLLGPLSSTNHHHQQQHHQAPYAAYAATAAFRPMSIVAPDPNASRRFPEPSPAACGKRKSAELAAAQMLAGVAHHSTTTTTTTNIITHRDGVATPPPLDHHHHHHPAPEMVSYNHNNNNNNNNSRPPMMNLQIVNPETLGITYEQRRTRGDVSPTTPWDGQLEALVRYVFIIVVVFYWIGCVF